MTTSSISTSTDPGQTGQTPGQTTTDSGGEDSTSGQAKHVADVAGQEARQVAGDIKGQARGLLDETRSQVQDQSLVQRDRLVETLRSFSDDLENMARDRSGLASDAAREVSQRARAFSHQVEGREPAELLDDLRSFARRRPGVFLAGALVSGVVVGRLLRGTRDAARSGTSSDPSADSYDAATTQERPVTSYDPTATSTVTPPPPVDEPLPPPGTGTTAYPPVTPGMTPVTSTESGRPVGGP